MLKRLCVLSGILILLLSVSSMAAAPRLINFQGKLTTTMGTPETGSKSLTFKLYTSDTAPTSIWQEPVTVTLDPAGQFSTVLGDITSLDVDFSQPLWLEVVYNGQAFSPRQRLSSVPYALYAITAESVVGGGGGGSSNWTQTGNNLYPINLSSNVGIGTAEPTEALTIVRDQSIPRIRLTGYGIGAGGPLANYSRVVGRFARNSQASPAMVSAGDALFTIAGVGFTENGFLENETMPRAAGAINIAADGNFTGSSTPGRIVLMTASSEGSVVPRVMINKDGNVGIGTMAPGGLLGLRYNNTYIDVDSSHNLTFTDPSNGTKTLAQLAAGGGGGTGDVVGPASASNEGVAVYDGTSGKLIKDTGNLLLDTANKRLDFSFDSGMAAYRVFSYGGGMGIAPSFTGVAARGTRNGPTAVASGDALAYLGGTGYGDTNFISPSSAGITLYAAENWTDNANGSAINFRTTPIGSPSSAKAVRMTITPSGNVGIGTGNPGYPLHISATPSTGILMNLTEPGSSPNLPFKMRFQGPNGTACWDVGGGDSSGNFQVTRTAFSPGDTPVIHIDKGNLNVGIGTTNPGATLEVAGQVKIVDGTQGLGKVLTSDDSGLASWQTGGGGGGTNYWTQSSNKLYPNATTWEVAVGTNETKVALKVVGSAEIGDASNSATGQNAVAMGYGTIASGDHSTAMGNGTTASGYASTAIGSNSNATDTYAVAIGYGANASGGAAIGNGVTANGQSSTALGSGTNAAGDYSTAMGYSTSTSGTFPSDYAATAMGYQTNATRFASTAMGALTKARGQYSTAMGLDTTASNYGSTAMGGHTKSSGWYTTAMGDSTSAESYASLVIGRYNVRGGTLDDWVSTDPLFVIGNGDVSNRSNAMTVLKNGKVGIGTTSPAYKLEVANDHIKLTDGFSLTWGSGSTFLWGNSASNFIRFRTNANDRMIIDSAGNVGIGTVSPTHLIHLNGGAYCDGTGDWITGSDRAYKKDIDYGFKYGLKEVEQLKPVYYVHKQDKENKKQIGFIAQDVLKVIPELVSGDEGTYGLSYGQLSAVLVKAVQEQQKIIDEQKKEIDDLKARLDKLESRFDNDK